MRTKSHIQKVQDYAESLGLTTCFSKHGDLIVKKRPSWDYKAVGLEMFEKYEGEPLQKDEIEHIITILIR